MTQEDSSSSNEDLTIQEGLPLLGEAKAFFKAPGRILCFAGNDKLLAFGCHSGEVRTFSKLLVCVFFCCI